MAQTAWNVGIVGCGRIAGGNDFPRCGGLVRTHAQAYHQHPSFEISAAVDPAGGALDSFQAIWGIPRKYHSLDEMLDREKLDVISVCSPAAVHHSQVMTIMRSDSKPKVLFVEKPVCLYEEQLDALIDLDGGHQAVIIVGHTRRFDPGYRRLAQRVRSQELGKLVEGRCTYFGGWIHNGVHAVDTIRMLFADEPRVVSATVSGPGRVGDPDLEVVLSVGGSPVELTSFDEQRYQIFEAEFRFELGRVRLLNIGESILVDRVELDQNGDRVLTPTDYSPIDCLSSPLKHAVKQIESFLRGSEIDAGTDLAAAALTMRIMFEAGRTITGNEGNHKLSPLGF